jgi:tRNA(His) 5'-end guanylyltransferase
MANLAKNPKKDSLGDRMKGYEHVERRYLPRRSPVMLRLDGKAFHSFTCGFQRPFDPIFIEAMQETCKYLCASIMGCKLAYWQSDEITLLLTEWETFDTQAWFDNNLQKMCSISASMATMAFNMAFSKLVDKVSDDQLGKGDYDVAAKLRETYKKRAGTAMFDSRVWVVPLSEVTNNFIWRQQDATRNAIQMLGQANFSHKDLQGVSCNEIQEKLFQEKGINFNDLPVYLRRGACIVKETYVKEMTLENPDGDQSAFNATRSRWVVDDDIPIFTADREYIEKFLRVAEEETK